MGFVNFSVDWYSTLCTCYTNNFSLNWTMNLLVCFIMQSEEQGKETSEKTQKVMIIHLWYIPIMLCQIKGIYVLKLHTCQLEKSHGWAHTIPTLDFMTSIMPFQHQMCLANPVGFSYFWNDPSKPAFFKYILSFLTKRDSLWPLFSSLLLIYKLDDWFWFNLDWSFVLPVLSWQLKS